MIGTFVTSEGESQSEPDSRLPNVLYPLAFSFPERCTAAISENPMFGPVVVLRILLSNFYAESKQITKRSQPLWKRPNWAPNVKRNPVCHLPPVHQFNDSSHILQSQECLIRPETLSLLRVSASHLSSLVLQLSGCPASHGMACMRLRLQHQCLRAMTS